MTQEDIRRHYETSWKQAGDAARDTSPLSYSSPVEDAVMYPIYEKLIEDLRLPLNGGRVLDVGCGSGRWVRFFLERFKPARLMGVDFTKASIDLLAKFHAGAGEAVSFRVADLAAPELDLGEQFDLINVANVLFHIPEADRFGHALRNLRAHLSPGGRIVTTEYMPRVTMRTEWMMVRSRYEFEKAAALAGLRILDIRACSFFSNDPMGIDGPDDKTRLNFNQVRAGMNSIFGSNLDEKSKKFFVNFLADVERACLSFCGERVAQVEMPAQKLVVLGA